MTDIDLKEARDWLRSRPPSVRALARRFPPGCVVRWKTVPGEHAPMGAIAGFVGSYYEGGQLGVRSTCPHGHHTTRAIPSDVLEVAETAKITAEDVAAMLIS